MSRRQNTAKRGFVLEIDGRPVLALADRGIDQATALCSEAWFLEELASCRSCGKPIWDGEAKLSLRRASPSEAIELDVALQGELVHREYEGYVFAFLVPLDQTRCNSPGRFPLARRDYWRNRPSTRNE